MRDRAANRLRRARNNLDLLKEGQEVSRTAWEKRVREATIELEGEVHKAVAEEGHAPFWAAKKLGYSPDKIRGMIARHEGRIDRKARTP